MSHSHGSPEEDIAVARQALQQGDLHHALHHVGGALSTDPMNAAWYTLQGDILKRADDPLALTAPKDGHTDFVTAATRAHAFAIRNDYFSGIDLLIQVAGVRPDVPYLAWADHWLRKAGPAIGNFDAVMQNILVPMARQLKPARSAQEVRNLEFAASMLNAIRQAHPTKGFVWYVSSSVLRKMNRAAEAVPLAQEGLRVEPMYLTAVGYAAALREAGQPDAAIAAYRECLRYQPDDASPHVDIGDIYLETNRFADAERSYQEALAKEPEHVWAQTSLLLARFKRTGSADDRAQLLAMRDKYPGHEDVERILEPVDPLIPYVNRLPPPGDSIANALAQLAGMLKEHPERGGGTVNVTVTHPESPSTFAAFRLATAHTQATTVEVKFEKIPTPDPRAPKGPVDFVAWTYQGTVAVPNVPPADPRLAEAIAHIAVKPYRVEDWLPHAAALGPQLGAAWLPHLVGAMVNPPPPREGIDPFLWVQRVQIATALVIAHLDQGWEGSARKRALTSLALGPVDWTVNAALVAMAALAKNDAAIRADVQTFFASLEKQIPQEGYCCFEYPLVCLRLWVGVDEQEAERLRNKRFEIESRGQGEEHDHEEEEDDEESYEGLNLAQYAEFCAKRDILVAKKMQSGGLGMGGVWPELEALCREYDVEVDHRYSGPSAARIEEWDERINADPDLQRQFFALKSQAQMNAAGFGQSAGPAQQADPDPVVFPGQRIAKLSDYVGLMKRMQTGDMQGALRAYGLDMQSYMAAAQAWGMKLASDPVLNDKFSKAMAN